MLRAFGLLAALVAALTFAVGAAGGTHPGPPLTYHDTACRLGTGPEFTPVVMWLTAGMAAGDTFWLDDGSHYVIQSYRVAQTASDQLPADSDWSSWASIGRKNGHADSSIECRGFFHDPDSTVYDWVDSIDYLIK